ncbi:helix-turn-helix domain-containing protein [Polyangium aurulentum]|uniref:helix-turn-helix domain-containing protein n=1 Tax=Polyangium aurulentum TaxID=2567896 RepID=UPI0010AE4FA1|nr:helix-turn-helix transcriptional regulator [Polyangium aurulentum]
MPRRTTPSPFGFKVGARIRQLRLERGLSLAEVADAGLLSKGHLSSVEHGLAAITIETIEKIARALGLLPMDLLTFPGDDMRAEVGDLVRSMPTRELPKLRRELQERLGIRKPRSPKGKA